MNAEKTVFEKIKIESKSSVEIFSKLDKKGKILEMLENYDFINNHIDMLQINDPNNLNKKVNKLLPLYDSYTKINQKNRDPRSEKSKKNYFNRFSSLNKSIKFQTNIKLTKESSKNQKYKETSQDDKKTSVEDKNKVNFFLRNNKISQGSNFTEKKKPKSFDLMFQTIISPKINEIQENSLIKEDNPKIRKIIAKKKNKKITENNYKSKISFMDNLKKYDKFTKMYDLFKGCYESPDIVKTLVKYVVKDMNIRPPNIKLYKEIDQINDKQYDLIPPIKSRNIEKVIKKENSNSKPYTFFKEKEKNIVISCQNFFDENKKQFEKNKKKFNHHDFKIKKSFSDCFNSVDKNERYQLKYAIEDFKVFSKNKDFIYGNSQQGAYGDRLLSLKDYPKVL